MAKPISPYEVASKKLEQFPEQVIAAFNELIAENWNGQYATVLQKDVVGRILAKFAGGVTRKEVFERHWLDIEDIYRKQGWVVEYDKPAYCETYEANFRFSKRRKRS